MDFTGAAEKGEEGPHLWEKGRNRRHFGEEIVNGKGKRSKRSHGTSVREPLEASLGARATGE